MPIDSKTTLNIVIKILSFNSVRIPPIIINIILKIINTIVKHIVLQP